MKAYETSTMTLKSLLAHPSLKRDKINETMEAMAEAAADHAEIDEAIKLGGAGVAAAAGMTIDDDELQEELQQMIDEKEREEAEAKEKEALEEVRKAEERREAEGQKEKEREAQAGKQHNETEGRKREETLVESDKRTAEEEERWLVEQAQRDREAENKLGARWEAEQVAI